jgi:hypothetical protein
MYCNCELIYYINLEACLKQSLTFEAINTRNSWYGNNPGKTDIPRAPISVATSGLEWTIVCSGAYTQFDYLAEPLPSVTAPFFNRMHLETGHKE